MSGKNILVVEDDPDILELLGYSLSKEGYSVTQITHGDEVITSLKKNKPDIILLDIMLPGTDGMELCRLIKANPDFVKTPVIMMTAKSEESDVVSGLEVGADDYITKPFSPKVLIARIRMALRRKKEEPVVAGDKSIIKIGEVEINKRKHEVCIKGNPVDLTFSEFAILSLLADKPGWVYSRAQIVDAIRGDNYAVSDRSVDVQIVGLRKKLGRIGKMITTVRGVGYKLKI